MESRALSTKSADCGTITSCIHCGTNTSGDQPFCCIGCETAYHLLHASGLSHEGTSIVYSALATYNDDNHFELILAVDGIHCASCIQLIENALYSEHDIVAARVNMSTKRLSITWQGRRERADAFVQIVKKLGYHVHPFDIAISLNTHSDEEKFLLRCMAVSGFAAGNLMMISVGLWSSTIESMGFATRDLLHWISALIALPTVAYAGRPFFYSALSALKEHHTNMDVPISLAILLASGMSVMEAINHGEHVYFDSAVMLTFFLLIGRYLDARAKDKARETAQALLTMLAGTATVVKDGVRTAIPIRDIREGMEIIVAAGENITADGIVSKGETEIDMALITGETVPKPVKQGDTVFIGTTNLSAPIYITVSKTTDQNVLSDIVKLMEKAEQGQARYVRLADKAAQFYTPVVHLMGLLTFLFWWLWIGEPWQPSLLHAITVLIITCPCALGLAVPVVQVLASSQLMKSGVLLKSGDALEKLATIDMAIFDKTGTLTLGKPKLQEGTFSDDHLQLAASLAIHSKHPLSKALFSAYGNDLLPIDDVEEIPGKGIKAHVHGQIVKLGSRQWCGQANTFPYDKPGILELWLTQENSKPVCFTFSDGLRKDACETIRQFKQMGIDVVLLSGDHTQAVHAMAQLVGINKYYAEYSPVDKYHYLETLKQEGRHLLMVGDGLNDAPSLAVANVSASPSSAIDISQNTADIVFQGDTLTPVFTSWRIACYANRLVKQNFALTILYNIIAIPLAVTGYVTPMVAAIAMSGSSLVVIGNSFRIKRLLY